jgi:peptidoglycan/LPS O-acetylase OafA/YrhL
VSTTGPARDDDAATPSRRAPSGTRFRPEIEGLRAVAVTLVVVYHVWTTRVSGGVDVLFVVSGFLLTGQLLRAARAGTLDVRQRWSRTVVRLVPSVAVVLLVTAVASAVVLPEGRWPQTLRELVAAALFVENWQLTADAVDYAARNDTTSVVQQFWSLSIQVQFFVLWPLLVAVVALGSRRAPHLLRDRLVLAAAAVVVASLVFSVELTASAQPVAYFHTLARLWELALGGLVALHLDATASPPASARRRAVLGWVGVLGLVACGPAVPVAAAFPGFAALWPTGCAALVLLAGTSGHRLGVDRLLAARPVQHLGRLSFALYLWHWPVLVLYSAARERERVGLLGGAGVIAVSLVLAALTHRLVERPLRARPLSTARGYRLGAGALVAVLLVVVTWQVEIARRTAVQGQLGDAAHPGAVALRTGPVDDAPVLPAAVAAYEDWVRIERWDCSPMSGFPMDVCVQPVEQPTRRILVVGDSHAQQLSGALVELARHHGWQVTAIVRGACPYSTASEVVPDEADCLAWLDAAAAEIAERRPDLVVTLASRDVRAGRTEQTPAGFVDAWRRLDELDLPVLALRDNPRFDRPVPDCLQQATAAECGIARQEVYADEPPWSGLDVPDNVTFLDTADALCDSLTCPAVVGNVLVYLDDNHLTATYSTSMAPLLEERVTAVVNR